MRNCKPFDRHSRVGAMMTKPDLKTCTRMEAIDHFTAENEKVIAELEQLIIDVESFRENNPNGSMLQYDETKNRKELDEHLGIRFCLSKERELEEKRLEKRC